MNAAIDSIARAFEARQIKFTRAPRADKGEEINAGVSCAYSTYTIRYISISEESDVAVRVFNLAKVPPEKTDDALILLNELNCKYRYFKFKLCKDMTVDVEYDILQMNDPEAVGKIGEEMLARFVKVIDDAYPQIMKCIWS